MSSNTLEHKKKRPLTVTLVGVVAIVAFLFYGYLGIVDIMTAETLTTSVSFPVLSLTSLDIPSVKILGGAYFILSAIAALVIGWGAFRMRRWAWIAFMAWCIFILTNQIVRYFADVPGYPAMVLAGFIVLALNQAEVQEAFGIITSENVESELEPISINPLDSK